MQNNPYEKLITDKAIQYGVEPGLALSIVKQESGFNPKAVSRVGAGGLMQLMPGTARDLGLSDEDRFDPEKNVDAGMRYFSQQMKTFGDPKLALAAYNAGPGNVRKAGNQIPQFRETQDYVDKVYSNWKGGSTVQPAQVATVQVPEQPQPQAPELLAQMKQEYQAQLDGLAGKAVRDEQMYNARVTNLMKQFAESGDDDVVMPQIKIPQLQVANVQVPDIRKAKKPTRLNFS